MNKRKMEVTVDGNSQTAIQTRIYALASTHRKHGTLPDTRYSE